MKLAEALAPDVRRVARRGAGVGRGAASAARARSSSSCTAGASEWGLSYVVVGDDNVDEFAPVVAKLAGT